MPRGKVVVLKCSPGPHAAYDTQREPPLEAPSAKLARVRQPTCTTSGVFDLDTMYIAHHSVKTAELRPFHHLPFTFAAYEQVVLQRITWACWTQTWVHCIYTSMQIRARFFLRIVFLCVCTQVLCWYFARAYLFMCSHMVQGSADVLVTITDADDNLIGSEETHE